MASKVQTSTANVDFDGLDADYRARRAREEQRLALSLVGSVINSNSISAATRATLIGAQDAMLTAAAARGEA